MSSILKSDGRIKGYPSYLRTNGGMSEHNNIKGRLRNYSKSDKRGTQSEGQKPDLQSNNPTIVRETLARYKYSPSASGTENSESNSSIMDEKELKKLPKPEKMSPQQWWKVYTDLNTTLVNLKTQISTLQGMTLTTEEGVDFKQYERDINDRLDELQNDTGRNETRINIMTNIIISQDRELKEMRREIIEMKRQKNRDKIRIVGLIQPLSETRSGLRATVQSFFKETMEIQEEIEFTQVYRMGAGRVQDRPVRVKLKNSEDKMTLFKNASNLKGKTNAKKQSFYVENELDPEWAEQRRCFRDLLKENKEDELDLTIKMRKDEIMVNNSVITKQIHSPTVSEMLKLDEEERKVIMNTKLVPVEEYQEKDSDYYVYVQKANSVDQVQKGLIKLRLKHGDATHVSCAYRLENASGPFNQEGHDDHEYGAGRTILRVLKQKGLRNISVFIVRYFGGTKLGDRRFKILQTLTETAIKTYGKRARDTRSKLFRSSSQESICSVMSALSYDDRIDDEAARTETETETDKTDEVTEQPK